MKILNKIEVTMKRKTLLFTTLLLLTFFAYADAYTYPENVALWIASEKYAYAFKSQD